MGVVCNQVPVEAHWSVGKVEAYHAPLRRAWEIITAETKGSIEPADALQMALKAVNDTAGPAGLVPTLLVFGAYPRVTTDSPPTASQQQRARSAYIASICQPEASFDCSTAAQFKEPDERAIKALNERI